MRMSCLALVSALLIAGGVLAQQPQSPPPGAPLDPQNNRLDAILLEWEGKMKQVQTLSAKIEREKIDEAFRVREVYKGTAKYMRPNLALLDLQKENNPQKIEHFVCTGTFLYEFSQDERVIRVHELPPPKPGQVADDNFLSFLFGMKAQDAKQRYELSLFKEPDEYYYYLRIQPRTALDKADFQYALLALTRATCLPRTLIFIEPNKNKTTWNIPVIDSAARLDRQEFSVPRLPEGWRAVRVPRDAAAAANRSEPPPRVVRPKP